MTVMWYGAVTGVPFSTNSTILLLLEPNNTPNTPFTAQLPHAADNARSGCARSHAFPDFSRFTVSVQLPSHSSIQAPLSPSDVSKVEV